MSDKDENLIIKQGEIIIDLITRVTVLEKILLGKNILIESEYVKEIEEMQKEILNQIINKMKEKDEQEN